MMKGGAEPLRAKCNQQHLLSDGDAAPSELHIPFLDLNGYYNFLSTVMISLFIIGLVIVFLYEYEALRRSKT
jgi:hypothetical protein